MSDASPNENPEMNPSNTGSTGSQPPQDWRELRRQERRERIEARRERRGYSSSGWIGGAVLIVIGIVFLLQNLSGFYLQNWWALFILIPAIGAFASAWNQYQHSGRLTAGARGSLIGGFVMVIISAFFLFGVSFGNFWPILLILGGLALLANAMLPS
jgi:hypothetical protein